MQLMYKHKYTGGWLKRLLDRPPGVLACLKTTKRGWHLAGGNHSPAATTAALSTPHGATLLRLVLVLLPLLVQVSEVPPRSTYHNKYHSHCLLYRARIQSPKISAVTTEAEKSKNTTK